VSASPPPPGLPGVHAHRVIFIDLARALAAVFMVYGHAIDALLAPSYKSGLWHDAWLFQRGLTSALFLLLSGFAFSVATGRHWASHTAMSAAWWRRVRRFAVFVLLGYLLHFPAGRLADVKYAAEPQWRSFYAVDVLQLIGVSFILVQCLVVVVKSRRAFTHAALVLAALFIALTPLMWTTDWSRWLPMGLWAYLSPVYGPNFPLFPLFPWSAFILVGAGLGQIYARWGGAHLRDFAVRALVAPGLVLVLGGYAAGFYPHPMFAAGARAVLEVDMLIRIGTCFLILAAIGMASARLTRLPHVFSAVAQETLLIYFIHLCIIYGSVWSTGLIQALGPTLDPTGMFGVVVLLVSAMAGLASWWNWLKHARPRAALWVGRAAVVVLFGGVLF
jgi:acyltransferase